MLAEYGHRLGLRCWIAKREQRRTFRGAPLSEMLSEAEPNADYNYERPLPDAAAMKAFFGPRDPSGVLRAQLEANGALSDGILDALEAQQLLFSILKA